MANRVAIFIDAGYLEKVVPISVARIDYAKLPAEVANGDSILRTYYYNCPPYQSPSPTQDERERYARADRFYSRLRKIPRFQVRLGRLAKRACRDCSSIQFQQKRVDILLGVDLVRLAAKQQITRAVLIAGDSDFLPAVEMAKDEGILLHLFHGGTANPAHRGLFDACDDRTEMTTSFIDLVKR